MFVWGAAQRGVPPEVNVIGTAMFVLALLAVAAGELISRARRA
jgi:spermidine/putrescine transport system permease protein